MKISKLKPVPKKKDEKFDEKQKNINYSKNPIDKTKMNNPLIEEDKEPTIEDLIDDLMDDSP